MPEAETVEKPEEQVEGSTKINKITSKGFKSFQQKTAVPFYGGLTAIVGENGSGKCVTGDTKVLMSDGSYREIRDIVEKAMEKSHEEIDDGYISYEGDEKILSLNPETLEVEEREVLAYAKREAPDHTFRIKTRSGREIEATEDHPLFQLSQGEVVATDAEDLKEGTKIAVPRKTEIEPDNKIFTELLDLIGEEDKLYVPYDEEFEDIIYELKEEKTWKQMSEEVGVSYNTLRGIRDKQACNFASLVKILRHAELTDEEITEKITHVESKNYSKQCKIPWQNTRELSRLLGYLLAEGRITENNQTRFANEKEEIVSNYENLVESIFEVETEREQYDGNCYEVLSYSQPMNVILEKFGISQSGSGGKKIPNTVLKNSGEEELGSLMEGLYAGDGYVSESSITLTTKSKNLAQDVQSVLQRLDIVARINRKEKTATNTGTKGTYYQVLFSGSANAEKFHQTIQIPHREKAKRVSKLTEKRLDTNLDTIEANELVREAADRIKIKANSRSNRQKIPKLGAYYSDKCEPSREGLKDVIEHIDRTEENAEQIDQLEKLASSDIYWDEIVSVERIETDKEWVYDLNIGVNHNFIARDIFVHNSNIIDAVSFVFGRRSSKLRAEKLEQLIFNGGDSRKPADHAKVTVYLDNSDGIFDEFLDEDEEAEEVKVGRKVTRAGSSMYKFQGSNCKRSKIDSICRKANIDPDGYHFVRQGKVTEIVEQSDTQRRKVIDELSGVAEFDEKKEEAEEELEEVEQKLQEQEILLEEKKEHLEKLKEEKELALKYRELEDRKEKLEASLLEVRKRALSNQLANINTETAEKEDRIEELEEELEQIDEEIDEKQDRIKEIEEKQSGGDTDIQHLENKIDKKRGQIENKRDKIDDLEETIEELEKMQSRKSRSSKSVEAVLSLDNDDIHGAFEDLISTEDRFAVAIDTAAGGHMNDVVVEDSNTAMDAINYLKRENIGRARMLPLDKIKDRSRSAKSKMAKKRKGVIDYAAELVNYDSEYETAINHVFSDTLVAEDLDSVKDIDGVRVVTLDGDVMSRGGAMTGGKKKRKKKNKSLSSNLDPEKKREEKQELEDEIEDLQKDIAELKKMKERREEDQETDEELREQKDEIREELEDLREDRQDKYSEKERLKTKIEDTGSKKANLKAELDNAKEDLEEYDFDEDELIGLDSSPEDLKSKKRKVVRKQNSMGPVNMRAIEEYKEKKEEFDDFKQKVSEVRQEKLEVEDMIEEIEREKRECFMETFEKISSSFSEIFERLFGGGSGQLVLENDDIEQGLKIRAQPPGKEPHIITALSGGEKTLTAIAFVFAILEYEESPFYLMDEIDAALDKTNSKKLSELLKDYAEDNQFIVISHNDITVRHAERAYGVSMRDGVSKVRSIELEE